MAPSPEMNRRTLLRAGLAVSAVSAAGLAAPALASAEPAQATNLRAPSIATTTAWGARPPNGTIEVLPHPPTYIVVHHTAGANSSDLSQAHAFQISREIQNFHMDTRGWIDTGQQLTNSRGGFVTEGRHQSLSALSGGTTHVMGANVADHNSDIIGIENEGLYTDVDVTPQLWNSLVNLVAYIADQYGIAPSEIKGHRDFNATECPGEVLYARLPELRDAVGQALGKPVEHRATWPLLKPGTAGPKVLAAQHLLRASGVAAPTDGVYGPSTFAAVQQFNATNKIAYDPCYASRVADESGLLGAGNWPSLVKTVNPGDTGDAAKAAEVLLRGRSSTVIDTPAWQALLT